MTILLVLLLTSPSLAQYQPTESSAIYANPFTIAHTATIKARSFETGTLAGATTSQEVIRYEWMKEVNVNNLKPGIAWQYFESFGKIDLAAIKISSIVKSGVASKISEKVKQRLEKYALSFDGFIKINKEGICNFSTLSDDGSKLYIDEVEIVNNDEEHGSMEQTGRAPLKIGYHKISVVYFDSGGGNELKVFGSWERGQKKSFPAMFCFIENK